MRLFGGILVAATGGQVYRIDCETGAYLKLYELTSNLEAHLTFLATHRKCVYANSSHRVLALDRDKLQLIWKSGDLGDRFECATICHHRLCLASDGEVHVLDLDSGNTVFTERFEGPRKAITLLADEDTDPERPLLYVGFCGQIHIIDIKAQRRLETKLTVSEDASFGVALALHRGLLIASSGGIINAFKTSEGYAEVWLLQYGHETGYGFMSSLHCARHDGKDLAIVGSNGYVVAVDLKTGTQLWMTSLPRGGFAFVSTLFYEGALYVASNGRMWSLAPDSGEVLWNMYLSGMGSHSPALLAPTARNDMASDTPILQAQKRTPAFSLFR